MSDTYTGEVNGVTAGWPSNIRNPSGASIYEIPGASSRDKVEELTLMFLMHYDVHTVNTRLDVVPCDKLIPFHVCLSFQLHQGIDVSAVQNRNNKRHHVGPTWHVNPDAV